MKPALIFIVSTIVRLLLLVLLLRFWLPWLRADFRNPIAQGILRLTSPLVIPVRRIIPPIGRLDTATVLIAFGVQYLALLVILAIDGAHANFAWLSISSLIELVLLSLNIFTFAIFIHIILSWVAPGTHNPATAFISTIVNPVLLPFRRWIPPLGGLDISPMIVIIALQAIAILVGDLRPGLI